MAVVLGQVVLAAVNVKAISYPGVVNVGTAQLVEAFAAAVAKRKGVRYSDLLLDVYQAAVALGCYLKLDAKKRAKVLKHGQCVLFAGRDVLVVVGVVGVGVDLHRPARVYAVNVPF